MAKVKPIVALIYDFDGTLSPGNMQEYAFIKATGMNKNDFWTENTQIAKNQDADQILTYMFLMLQKAKGKGISLKRTQFKEFGKSVDLFNGVQEWFDRINEFGKSRDVIVEHYINSSGLKEMIEGTSIAKKFKKIFACSYLYNVDGIAEWPAVSVNFTNKTQFLFKINKGIDSVFESKKINEFIPESERRVPFSNMVYFGDGETDIPCMKLVKDQGGHSIAVYQPGKTEKKKRASKLIIENRVNFVCQADYSENKEIDKVVKTIIEKIKADSGFNNLLKKHIKDTKLKKH